MNSIIENILIRMIVTHSASRLVLVQRCHQFQIYLKINIFSHCMQLKALNIFGKERYAIVFLSAVVSCGWLRFLAVDLNRTATEPQPNRNRTATEPQPNHNRTATEPQPNRNRTATEPQPNRNRTATEPQPNRNRTATAVLGYFSTVLY